MSVATRLKALRLERGLTQLQLATPRYTAAFVSSIEAGRRRPSASALEHFAARLGVEVEELATGVAPGERAEAQIALQEQRALVAGGNLDRAEEMAVRTEIRARELGWTREVGQAQFILGLVAEQRGAIDDAIGFFESAYATLAELSPLAVVDALAGKTRCLQIKGELRYAIHLLETHLEILRAEGLDDPGAQARVYASLVAAYFDAGLQKQAEEVAALVFELMPVVKDPDRLANMHINTARVLLEQGRYDEVKASLQRAEELYIDLHWKNDLGRVYMGRGVALLMEDRAEEAISDLDNAISIFRATGHVVNEIRSSLQLARSHRLMNRIPQATLVLKGVQLGAAAGPLQQGIAHREFGLCRLAEGEVTEALSYLEQALGFFEAADDAREIARTYRLLGDVMRDQDSLVAACDAYRSAAIALEDAA